MKNIFVYSNVPQPKFQLNFGAKFRQKNQKKFTLSQKYFKQQKSDKALFKTRKNILASDYTQNSKLQMAKKSVLLSAARPSTMQSPKVRTAQKYISIGKFQKVSMNQIVWQKWKQPTNILQNNKQFYTQRPTSLKQSRTESAFISRDQREIQTARQEMRKRRAERELRQLNRLRQYIDEKRSIINLMGKIQDERTSNLQRIFDSFREEAAEMCEIYNKKKVGHDFVSAVVKTSIR